MKHNRKFGSIKKELATKARESMLSAVQIYNNPNIQFKSETFIVLSIIAWTYLIHAYYKAKGIDYCYYSKYPNGRKKYDKTKYGAKKPKKAQKAVFKQIVESSISRSIIVDECVKYLMA